MIQITVLGMRFPNAFILAQLLLILCETSMSQVGTLNTLNLPLSPDAAALGKYVEMPVGFYTGTSKIDVPLFEFDVKDLNIPISLGYHASRVRVKDCPKSCGR